MQFRTEIPIKKYNFPIDYHSKVLLLGSCFAENMGDKFQYFKFQAKVNPFGIIFNPVSLEKLIKRVVEKRFFTEEDIFYHNDLWHCFEVHSELSNPDKEAFLNHLNQIIKETHQQIKELSHCIITLGTSWVYGFRQAQPDNVRQAQPDNTGQAQPDNVRRVQPKSEQQSQTVRLSLSKSSLSKSHQLQSNIVANCHKVPQNQFTKELLSSEQIEESLQNITSLVHSINPNCQFIFTVSPVRHIKDGFVENNVSKGNLLVSIYNIMSSRAESRDNCKNGEKQVLDCARTDAIGYFPSYEIMLDELRDYRFYADDMLHPNQMAIDYIWIKFFENYISETEFRLMNEICSIQKDLAHKPFNPNTEAHQKFIRKLKEKIQAVEKENPSIVFK